jgi:hypothetical protein
MLLQRVDLQTQVLVIRAEASVAEKPAAVRR